MLIIILFSLFFANSIYIIEPNNNKVVNVANINIDRKIKNYSKAKKYQKLTKSKN